jgi:hypothetical protein
MLQNLLCFKFISCSAAESFSLSSSSMIRFLINLRFLGITTTSSSSSCESESNMTGGGGVFLFTVGLLLQLG